LINQLNKRYKDKERVSIEENLEDPPTKSLSMRKH
jgi:hypothetical protein